MWRALLLVVWLAGWVVVVEVWVFVGFGGVEGMRLLNECVPELDEERDETKRVNVMLRDLRSKSSRGAEKAAFLWLGGEDSCLLLVARARPDLCVGSC